ncbi:MAG: T9SS type A sorting domain-containing protein [Candidatus Azobacteroides sp.]|nr:T9SS type A sorting domain-containing protein [Candidatus Azobacteroides sp.]
MNIKYTFILLLFSLTLLPKAQQVITTVGNEQSGVIWTIGDIIITPLNGNHETVFLTQGFLQPEYKSVTDIATIYENDRRLNVYPNPVVDILNIKLKRAPFSWEIYDSLGKLINNGKSVFSETTLDFSNHPKGYYILVIITEEERSSVKVIK